MVNYDVEPAMLEPLVPRGAELDYFEGRTYLSVVGFLFRETRVLGCSVPWHCHFPEVNLRFYVRRTVGDEVRRGVTFVREIVPRRAISVVARLAYNEPYVTAAMRHEWQNLTIDSPLTSAVAPTVRYQWRHGKNWLGVGASAEGGALPLLPDSHAEFIAEHYWGYCRQRDGGTIEYEVEHPPWHVWENASPHVSPAVADYYGKPFAETLRQEPASAFIADGSAVNVYRPTRIA
jgi:uncharacterized protein